MSKPFDQARIDRIRRLYETHGITVAAEIARTTPNTIRGIRKRGWTVGKEGPPVRPMPNDYAIQSAVMTVHQMKDHYGASLMTIQRWSKEIGRANLWSHHRLKPVPSDLAIKVRELGPEAAARHWGVSDDTVRKWRRNAGLPIKGKPRVTTGRDWFVRAVSR